MAEPWFLHELFAFQRDVLSANRADEWPCAFPISVTFPRNTGSMLLPKRKTANLTLDEPQLIVNRCGSGLGRVCCCPSA